MSANGGMSFLKQTVLHAHLGPIDVEVTEADATGLQHGLQCFSSGPSMSAWIALGLGRRAI